MATITPIKPHTRIDNEIIDDYLPQIGTYGFTIYSVINPTTPLSLALRFSAFTMREIGLVIAPLDPGHEGEALLNRIRMQG